MSHARTALALCLASLLAALAPACGGGGGGGGGASSGAAASSSGGAGPAAAAPSLGSRFDPATTVTIFVGGYAPNGASRVGPFGADSIDALARQVATPLALPTSDVAPLAKNQLASCEFYGDVPPAYYSAADLVEVAAAPRGVPRYALIVAKFAREVLARSGAAHVNLVAASLGGMITRHVIELDLEGLASGGRIARWVTLESAAGGVWAVSQPLLAAFLATQMDPTDGVYLHYDAVKLALGTPDPRRSVSPFFADILVGHELSGRPDPEVVSLASLLPSDGALLVRDQWLHEYDARRALGRPGAATVNIDTSHQGARTDQGLYIDIANFLRSSRRATVRLTSVTLLRSLERPGNGVPDVVLEARVRSPDALREWGFAGEVACLRAENGTAPLAHVQQGGTAALDATVFDWPVAPREQALEVEVRAVEENMNPLYGVYETIVEKRVEIDRATIAVPVGAPGAWTFTVRAAGFEAGVAVDVLEE